MKSTIITTIAILGSWIGLLAQGIVSTNGLLKVNGNQIENNRGVPFSVAGNSMFWSSFENDGGTFYQTEVVNHLAENWGSQIVRAAIGVEEADGSNISNFSTNFPGGLVPNPSGSGLFNNYDKELAKAKIIIDAAIANDIYVIVDFHSHYAHHFEDLAIRFFEEIATEYGDNDNIIYEIFNEPINSNDFRITGDPNTFGDADFTQTWASVVKPYAINVINAIRAIDPDNLIVVGTPGFSQGVATASNDPITEQNLNLNGADLNVAYTLHFYAAGGYHDHLIEAQAQRALDNGIALFVTEWGTVEPSGDGDVNEAQTKIWIDFMKENNISHANWSITDKAEGASTIQPAKGIDGLLEGDLSESGSFVQCIIENWQSDSFDNCSATEVEVVDSESIPNGQGSKIELESGVIISPNDELGLDWVGNSGNVETSEEFDGEGIVSGLGSIGGQWLAATFDGSAQGDYTLQFVVSSDSDGHGIILQRQEGEENLTGLIDIPNTGGLNNYQIVTIPGIPFSSTAFDKGTAQDLSISIQGGGSGSFNIESFYMILDEDFDDNSGGGDDGDGGNGDDGGDPVVVSGVVSTNGLLKVNGSQIENKQGNAYSVAGNSMFWSAFETVGGKFYQTEVVDHLAQEWGSGIVRAAIGVEEADGSNISNFNTNFPGGLVPNPNGSGLYNNYEKELAKAKVIIDAAIANDIYVIVDFHTHFAQHFEDIAIRFFEEIATEYGDNDNIIYEIFNEPINANDFRITGDPNTFTEAAFNETWGSIIKPYAINVINAIRAIDPDNMIVVGTPGFSQGVGAAARNPIVDEDLDLGFGAELNIAYTLHFYAGQTEHDSLINSAINAMDDGIALFVTEWGTVEASGDGAVDEAQTKIWMSFLKENNISHANWSITDKFEGASVVEGNGGIDGLLNDELTSSGGFVRCIIEGWQSGEFETCEAEEEEEVEEVDSPLVPNGVGIKFEVERPTELDANTNSRVDFIDPKLSIGSFDGEGILSGFVNGAGVTINANGFLDSSITYTVQIVVSANGEGNFVLLIDDDFNFIDGAFAANNGLNNYEIITLSGIDIGPLQNIRISVGGDNPMGFANIESFYIIPDSEFNDAVLSTPEFDAELVNSVSVYPNPVVDYINVSVDTNDAIEYRIFDFNGKELISKTEYIEGGVDVQNLSNGMYFIQLYIKDQTQVYKFIK